MQEHTTAQNEDMEEPCSACYGPWAANSPVQDFPGKIDEIAYDSHMQNLENFVHELEEGETIIGQEQVQNTSVNTSEEAEDWKEQCKAENPPELTDF